MTSANSQCRRCGEAKPADLMKRDARNKSGLSSFCRDCHQRATVAWQKANPERLNRGRRARYEENKDKINVARRAAYDPERARWGNRGRLYKMSCEQFENMLAEQGGGCAICGLKRAAAGRDFSVDHDHRCCPKTPTCGRCNRGILCHPCNVALHRLEGFAEWGKLANTYLEKQNG